MNTHHFPLILPLAGIAAVGIAVPAASTSAGETPVTCGTVVTGGNRATGNVGGDCTGLVCT